MNIVMPNLNFDVCFAHFYNILVRYRPFDSRYPVPVDLLEEMQVSSFAFVVHFNFYRGTNKFIQTMSNVIGLVMP